MGKPGVRLSEDVHKRLGFYGNLDETYSEAIDRALDEAGAPEVGRP